jgi:AefR-like transcriptional repressor, C-terminal domain
LLAAGIKARAERMRRPIRLAEIQDHRSLARTLTVFGATLLRETSDPQIVGVFRLAIAESTRSPGIARTLNQAGRETNQAVLAELLEKAQALSLVAKGDCRIMVARFLALLWADLLLRLLLRVATRPTVAEAELRATGATDDFLKLYGVR